MGYAFIELRRFDEAIVEGKKALRQNPSYVGAYRCLASAFAPLGPFAMSAFAPLWSMADIGRTYSKSP
jgi:adenylate cyclase